MDECRTSGEEDNTGLDTDEWESSENSDDREFIVDDDHSDLDDMEESSS